MATRRRYKTKKPVDAAASAPVVDRPTTSPPAPETTDNPLQRALEAARHAEEMHRQRHQPEQQQYHGAATLTDEQQHQIATYVDSLPISDHKKAFLRQYPQLLVPPLNQVMAHHYTLAKHSGVRDDTEAMNQAILTGVDRDIQTHQRLMASHAPMHHGLAEAHLDVDGAADELAREAAEHLAASEHAAPAIPARRSIPLSAPVSRDVPTASGGRRSEGENTLSADERQIAHVSFPHLARPAAEWQYLQNRKKMHEMKASGAIQGDR